MKQRNSAIDLAKFIMAVFVVAIHVRPFTGDASFFYNDCLTRIADPLFFSITSYFLFRKMEQSGWKGKTLLFYLRRIGILYGIWIIIYLPRILEICRFCVGENAEWKDVAIYFLRRVLLIGPYGAMWFLTALLLAIPLTYVIARYLSPGLCLLLSAPFYLFTSLEMTYRSAVADIVWMETLRNGFENVFEWLANGLNYGFFFCALGMYIAVRENRREKQRNRAADVVMFLVSLIFLIAECWAARHFQLAESYGAMLSLMPVTYFGLWTLLEMRLPDIPAFTFLQKMSILIFVTHYGIMEWLQSALADKAWYINSSVLPYAVVLLLSCGISAFVVWLSGKKYFRWLRCLY